MGDFGDRMKAYEGKSRFIPLLPIVIRLDGKGFSKWTKGLTRPYDKRMSDLMVKTTSFLVKETNATIGYTQSDEITLILYSSNSKSDVFFSGKTQKIVSVVASMCTAYFNNVRPEFLPYLNRLAMFDCRAWNVPTLDEAANAILWREIDATKNSIQMAGHHYFSHSSLLGLNTSEIQEKLFSSFGVNWNDYPQFFKRGTFVKRVVNERTFSSDELSSLPEKHDARSNPNLTLMRSEIKAFDDLPRFSSLENRVGFIFNSEDPIVVSS